VTGRWFSVYSGFLHHKNDRHDMTEILLKVALNIITLTPNPAMSLMGDNTLRS
jgi:hypothetical protein